MFNHSLPETPRGRTKYCLLPGCLLDSYQLLFSSFIVFIIIQITQCLHSINNLIPEIFIISGLIILNILDIYEACQLSIQKTIYSEKSHPEGDTFSHLNESSYSFSELITLVFQIIFNFSHSNLEMLLFLKQNMKQIYHTPTLT